MTRKLTLVMPDKAAYELKHGYYAIFLTDEQCAHSNLGPCTQEHRCAKIVQAKERTYSCGVFKSEHHGVKNKHTYIEVRCHMSTCKDCGEAVG